MKIRAVQLDLARQKENLEFIFSFIDFVRTCQFNTLVLYLEGTIQTRSFPWRREDHSYKPREIRTVVEYAHKNHLDVIPVVSALGHMEQFLETAQLRPLAELADDSVPGRWPGRFLDMVCPSRKETHAFLERYVGEIAELFPSRYFHVGLDESWQIGMCEVCRERFNRDGKGDFIFADHVKRLHGILKSLGKTMLMWDDMFEIYPEALRQVPKDIILCPWYYDYIVERPQGHFLNQVRDDVLDRYDRLGFKYLFCPGPGVPNIHSFTRYAQRYHPLGGLVTNWEKRHRFYFEAYPGIAFAGKLWKSPRPQEICPDALLKEVLAEVTQVHEPAAASVLRAWHYQRDSATSIAPTFARGEVSPLEEERSRIREALYEGMKDAPLPKHVVVQHICIDVRERINNYRLRKEIAAYIAQTLGGRPRPDLAPLLAERRDIQAQRSAQWRRHRKDIPAESLRAHHRRLNEAVPQLLARIDKAEYFLFVRFFLPDIWGNAWLNLKVIGAKGRPVTILDHQTLKPPMEEQSFYEGIFPFTLENRPERIRIEARGYGGQGLAYLWVVDKRRRIYVPSGVLATFGQVHDPLNVLADDLRWCYLGEREVRRGFLHPEFSHVPHGMEIRLSPEDSNRH